MKVFACGTSWGSNRDQFMKAFQWEENVVYETTVKLGQNMQPFSWGQNLM